MDNQNLIKYEEENYKIYVHVNKFNGKLYIGQSKNIKNRWRKNGYEYKKSPVFYNAIQKYGWDGFDHIVLISNLSSEMADIIEKELIQKYNTTKKKYGYNISSGGKSSFSVNSFTKEKMSKAKKRCVYQFDLKGNLINKYDSNIEAQEKTGIRKTGISDAINGRVKHCGGYLWSHELVCPQELIDNVDPSNKYLDKDKINVYDLTGKYLETKNLYDIKYTERACIKYVCSGDQQQYKNYQYRRYLDSDMDPITLIPKAIEPIDLCIVKLEPSTMNIIKAFNTKSWKNIPELSHIKSNNVLSTNTNVYLINGFIYCQYKNVGIIGSDKQEKEKFVYNNPVGKFDKEMNLIAKYINIGTAAREEILNKYVDNYTEQSLGINISKNIHGKIKSILGYKWYMLNENDEPIIQDWETNEKENKKYYETHPTPGNEQKVYDLIKDHKELRQYEIIKLSGMKRDTLSHEDGVLNRLIRKGLINKEFKQHNISIYRAIE